MPWGLEGDIMLRGFCGRRANMRGSNSSNCRRLSTRRVPRVLLLAAATAAPIVLPVFNAAAQTFSADQLDYYYNDVLYQANTDVHRLSINYTPTTATQFLNVVDSNTGQWIVQNEPLLTSDNMGSAPITTSVDYAQTGGGDMIRARNAAVGSLHSIYTFSSAPVPTPPVTGNFLN